MRIKKIWWRRITANDLYNIEKPLPPGPKGQLHLDVPNVEALHDFFGMLHDQDADKWSPIDVDIKVFQDPSVSKRVTFRPRPKNSRYDIQRQNINSDSSERHPAWTSAYGWPHIHGQITSTKEATEFLESTPLVILILQSSEGEVYADFLSGSIQVSLLKFGLDEIISGKSTGCIGEITSEASDLIQRVLDSNSEDAEVVIRDVDLKEKVLKVNSKRLAKGQGFGLSPAMRRAVEKHAVKIAIEYFTNAGWQNIEDVGDHASYDLSMVRDGQVHIVEVKGTTGLGSKIILTRNEVLIHGSHQPFNALVVVSEIKVVTNDPPLLSGGLIRVIQPWSIIEDRLTALTFSYDIPI
jgi:hypothetical protein